MAVTVAIPVVDSCFLDGPPDFFGGQGHFQAGYSQGAQGVDYGVVDGYGGGYCSRFADALDAQRVVGRRRFRGKGFDVGHQVGAGQGVVQHGAGQQLPVVVVDRSFPEGLSGPLHHAAVDLALDDHRVNLGAAVVHRHVAFQDDMAVVRVHADHRHMGAEGIGEVGRVVEGGGLQSRLHARGHVPGHVGHQGYVLDSLSAVGGAANEEVTIFVLDVRFGGLQQVGGQGDCLGLDLAGAQGQRAAADHRGAAAVGAPAHGRGVGVAVDNLHVVHGDAQLIGHNLGEGGLLALAVGRRANEDVDLAGGVEAHRGALPQAAAETDGAGHLGGPKAADFAVTGYADAGNNTALAGVGLFVAQLVIVDVFQGYVQGCFVVATVVGQADGHVMAVVEFGNQVQAADSHRVLAHLRRQQVHQALQQEGGLGTASATVGLHRGGVGEAAVDVGLDVGDIVGTRVHQAVQNRRYARGRGGKVGPHAGVDHAADAGNAAIVVSGHFHVFHVVATVGTGNKVLGTGLGPLDGTAQLHGAEGGNHLPGIDGNLGAEPAAHLGGDNANLVLRYAGHEAGNETGDMGILGGVPDGQVSHRGHVAGDGGTGLHGVGNQPLLNDGIADHHVGSGKGVVSISSGGHPVESLVARGVLMQLGRALPQGGLGIDHGGQGLVVHADQFQRVLSLVAVFSHHHGHCVAHIPDHVFGQGRVGHGPDVGVGDHPRARHGVEDTFGIGAGIDGQDTGGSGGGGSIYAVDAGMAVGTAQDGRVDHARQFNVISVRGLSGNQAGVFAAANTGTEYSGSHRLTSTAFG